MVLDVLHVVGARPNFMKVAPVMRALRALKGEGAPRQRLLHTGQHYDFEMSQIFFRDLDIPRPDVDLGVAFSSHARQTAEVMMGLERVLLERRPDLVLVYGDVNSTLAAALVCAQLHIAIGHVEAGLRSFDRTMPEEINRAVTDRVADLLFTPSADADRNLLHEGIESAAIHFTGNVMIDTLVSLLARAEQRWPSVLSLFDDTEGARAAEGYGLVTLHRPRNVDDGAALGRLVSALEELGRRVPLIFPVHPRTRRRTDVLGRKEIDSGLKLVDPLGYVDFLSLERHAAFVVTDSGGIQEETTYLGVPCFTVRNNTERPVTVEIGTNTIVGEDADALVEAIERFLTGETKKGAVPPLWDGRAGHRIAAVIEQWADGCGAGRVGT